MIKAYLSLLSLLSPALAAPSVTYDYLLKESIHPPRGWAVHSQAPSDHMIEMRIGIARPNFPLLEKHLYEVSDPTHVRYGQHLGKDQVDALAAPHQESINLVNNWLALHGLEENVQRSAAQDWVTVTIPVRTAETMLGTTYHVWKHETQDDYLVRCTNYSLPSHLHHHIDVIQPTTMFGRFKGQVSTIYSVEDRNPLDQFNEVLPPIKDPVSGMVVDATCVASVTINCLRQLYNTKNYKPSANSNSTIGVTGYLEQFANINDLQLFYGDQLPEALGTSFEYHSVNGGQNPQNVSQAGEEASLDTQFAFGMAFPLRGTFYSTAGRPPFNADMRTTRNTNEPYAEWLEYVNKQDNPPLVIATSYGDDEQTVPRSYAVRVCQEFAKLGARGISILFSSGDWGVGDGSDDPEDHKCFTNDGKNIHRFIPTFPASCPYVTSVGSTEGIPEVPTTRFSSGGGFSDYFARPDYQETAVMKYLDAHQGVYKDLYNPRGRGFPDVAALGEHYRVWVKGSFRHVGGTSASTPTWAAIIALLNDVRFSMGKPPLGFLNPLIYSKVAHTLNDITTGSNEGCGTEGFNATVGWDPVTGLGSPNFEKLRAILADPNANF